MKIEVHKHRRELVCLLVALFLVFGAVLVSQRPANQPQASEVASTFALPSDITVSELGQWCVDHNTPAFKRNLTTNARNFLKACLELWGAGLTPNSTSTPTATPTAPATSAPPTITPTTTGPPAATTPPATAPPVTSPPVTSPPAPVVHGRDITQANTGWAAWTGADGQRCTVATMKVYTARVSASALGGSATCVWLQAGISVDVPIALTAARIDSGKNDDAVIRADGPHLTISWSTIDGRGTNGTYGVGGHGVDVYRSQILGSSDGVRLEGMRLIESWIRTYQTDPADHNDGIQAYQASQGGSILRCNIDARPTNGTIFGNAAIFLADDSSGEVEIRDNYLSGGGYTLRLHESQMYRATGNVVADWGYGPLSTTNAASGAFLEWFDNKTLAGDTLTP